MKTKTFFLVFFCTVLLSGCAEKMRRVCYIDEIGNSQEVMRSVNAANNAANWKELEKPMEATFCTTAESGCTIGKVYPVTKYLPKKFLGYQYVIFKNDKNEEGIFLVDNLPYNSDRVKMKNELERIEQK